LAVLDVARIRVNLKAASANSFYSITARRKDRKPSLASAEIMIDWLNAPSYE